LTGILYRRLKVDNGIKIWHYNGVLAHQIDAKEMYQVSWRPDAASLWPERLASSPVPEGIKPASPGTFTFFLFIDK
jgi:translation initiation factor 2A